MEGAVLVLVALACPLGMGLCMWLMARGMKGDSAKQAELRSEQDRLAAEIARVEREAGSGTEEAPSRDARVHRA